MEQNNNQMLPKLWQCLRDVKIIWIAAALLVQQFIAASSTIWLAQLISAVDAHINFWIPGGLYLLSLALPYFPGIAANIGISYWKQAVVQCYLQLFVAQHRAEVGLWTDREERERRLALLTSEVSKVLHVFVSYVSASFVTFLNVLLNVITLSVIVEPYFLVGYVVSFIMLVLLMWLQARRQHMLATFAQESRVTLNLSLLNLWDNVLLANTEHAQRWGLLFEKRFRAMKHQNVSAEAFQYCVSLVAMLLVMLPTFSVVSYMAWIHQDDFAYLAVVVVSLPRIFLILNYTYELVLYGTSWPHHTAQLKGVVQSLQKVSKCDLESRVQWSALRVSNGHDFAQMTCFDDFDSCLPSRGRVIVRGPNGSGKTSALLQLKQRYCNESIFIPAEHHLALCDDVPRSMGQRTRQVLEEIVDVEGVSLVLLDEWDANLDDENRKMISQHLDRLAQSCCVVEVLHRKENYDA